MLSSLFHYTFNIMVEREGTTFYIKMTRMAIFLSLGLKLLIKINWTVIVLMDCRSLLFKFWIVYFFLVDTRGPKIPGRKGRNVGKEPLSNLP